MLHDRRSWRSRQILTLALWVIFDSWMLPQAEKWTSVYVNAHAMTVLLGAEAVVSVWQLNSAVLIWHTRE